MVLTKKNQSMLNILYILSLKKSTLFSGRGDMSPKKSSFLKLSLREDTHKKVIF